MHLLAKVPAHGDEAIRESKVGLARSGESPVRYAEVLAGRPNVPIPESREME
jgi:hypothetical protein